MIYLFITILGFIIGLGAVTVIDIHGFLGRKSPYWTDATTRTHKVTKPLIWIGIFCCILGATFLYKNTFLYIQYALFVIMIANGSFLSFSVSPFLLKREKENRSSELLPKKWQTKITFSFLVSFATWWASVFLFVYHISL